MRRADAIHAAPIVQRKYQPGLGTDLAELSARIMNQRLDRPRTGAQRPLLGRKHNPRVGLRQGGPFVDILGGRQYFRRCCHKRKGQPKASHATRNAVQASGEIIENVSARVVLLRSIAAAGKSTLIRPSD